MKTASGYYTIHWDCPECGIHNEDLERDLNKSEDRLIGFCEYCCSNLIIDVETDSTHGLKIAIAGGFTSLEHLRAMLIESYPDLGVVIHDPHDPTESYEDILFRSGNEEGFDFIPIIQYEIPKIQTFTYRYENWDREGMLHMKDVHGCEFALRIGKTAHSVPALCRRMEKRPYSGNCNLRFN